MTDVTDLSKYRASKSDRYVSLTGVDSDEMEVAIVSDPDGDVCVALIMPPIDPGNGGYVLSAAQALALSSLIVATVSDMDVVLRVRE